MITHLMFIYNKDVWSMNLLYFYDFNILFAKVIKVAFLCELFICEQTS